MEYRFLGPALACAWCLISMTPAFAAPAARESAGAVLRHDLFVQIDPDRHALVVTDRLTIEPGQAQVIRLSLAPTLRLDRLVVSSFQESGEDAGRDVPFTIDRQGPVPRIIIEASSLGNGPSTLTASYHGTINDPPQEPRHLRFVTPSETAGHIGAEGVYLSSETHWYLDVPNSLSEYRLRVALPGGWTAVTHGKAQNAGSCPLTLCSTPDFVLTEWDQIRPAEALTVVANRFVAKTRDWSSKDGQPIQLAAYLFPDNSHLADEYLDATARYLETYIALLGPYPFDTFAVVENFFPSGLGMPSFTLLGSGVIKRHYVQPYALGHEIVHSWIGNAVYNRTEQGNWVEGLTTYLANYYWHEWSGDQNQARDQRRLMLRGYNLHVPPERDYPLRQFTQKHDERDNAIGYQKSALVFHLLRQEIGDQRFWRSLKDLVAQYRGRPAEWEDLERVFAKTAGRDLRWFFAQWVERNGAPNVSLRDIAARPASGGAYSLHARVVQTGPVFHAPLPIRMRMSDGDEQTIQLRLEDAERFLTVPVPSKPVSLEIDPDATVLRRIPREDLPPVLNHFVTDPTRSVVAALGDPADAPHPFREVLARIQAQDGRKPVADRTAVMPFAPDMLWPPEGSVLILATPATRSALQPLLETHCGRRVEFRDQGVTIAGGAYDGGGVAVLVSCHRRDQPGSVVTWLYAVSPQAATTVARLLFFYGWNSFVVFQDGKPTARGEWEPVQAQMEVPIDEPQSGR